MIINSVAYKDGKKVCELEHSEISDYLKKEGFIVWVAVKDPTPNELAILQEEFDLPDLAVEDAQHGHQRPKIESYGNTIFAVIHVPEMTENKLSIGELNVFFNKNYVLSIRNNSSQNFNSVRERLENDEELLILGTGIIFYALVDSAVDKYFPILYGFETEFKQIEQAIFGENIASRESIKDIYSLKSMVSQLELVVSPLQEAVMKVYADPRKAKDFDNMKEYFRDVSDHLIRITVMLGALVEKMDTAMTANILLITIEDSGVNKRLAAWGAIFAIDSLLAGVWGMNFAWMPELTWKYGYVAAIGAMVIVSGYLYYLFKRSDWL